MQGDKSISKFKIFLKQINQFFPCPQLAMLFYVQLIALILNPQMYDFRNIATILCWLPIINIFYLLSNKKFVYRIIVTIEFLLSFVNLCNILILKISISVANIFIVLNTNAEETKEFLDTIANPRMLLVLPFIFLYIIAMIKVPQLFSIKKSKWFLIVFLLISGIYISETIYRGYFLRKACPHTISTAISFYDEYKNYKKFKTRKLKTVEAQCDNKNKIFVLIIGESGNKNHCSLYGYHRKTTPKLDSRKDIFVYNDVISPYGNTIQSIIPMLTESNIENNINFNDAISVFDILHSAGYKTYWLSNQSPIGVWDNAIYNIAQTSDFKKFINIQSNSSFESLLNKSYDQKLIPFLINFINEKTDKKFIVIHLMGSHTAYKNRYPNEINDKANFSEKGSKEDKIIAEYDKSLYYTDFVIDSIFNVLKEYSDKNPNTIISSIYLSDHGENVYDEGENVGHGLINGVIMNSVSEIPFIVWVNDNFKKTYPDITSNIINYVNYPYMADDLFHSIIDINNIETKYFEKSRSIFNSDYNKNRIRVMEDGQVYKQNLSSRE